ncbi:T9SS type A sorting domain-containing protein [bacterium]|nr:T9SS type A sorting domain-containing protein [bacterium]
MDGTYSESVLKPDYTNSVSIKVLSDDAITLQSPNDAFISSTTVEGTLVVADGGTLNVENKAGDDLVIADGGELEVSGTLNIGQSATLVGATGSIITFNGDSNLSATTVNGSLVIEDGVTLTVVNNPGDDLDDENADIDDLIINGYLTVTGTLNIDETTKVIGNENSTITFNGSSAQSVTSGITSVYNLTIDNSAGVTLPDSIAINGLLTITSGNYDVPTSIVVDGLQSPSVKRLAWPKTDFNIDNYSASTSVSALFPNYINRSWNISGNIADTTPTNRQKTITFYWDASEDNSYAWGSTKPVLYGAPTGNIIANELVQIDGDTRSATFVYTFPQNLKSSKGELTIGLDGDQTLPVQLSTFNAFNHSSNNVMIQWVTQSESDLDGYRLYRNVENSLDTAIMLDTFIPGTNTSQTQTYSYIDNTISANGIYYYWIQMLDYDGSNSFYGPAIIQVETDYNGTVDIPLVTGLVSIYPNPFNPTTTIRYSLEVNSPVTIDIYNIKGQLVKTFDLGIQAQGFHQVVWQGDNNTGNDLPSGIYFSKMKTQDKVDIKKVMLLK